MNKPTILKLTTASLAAVTVLALTPAITSGEFDLTGLNAQVQNQGTRLTNVETKLNITPSPTPEDATPATLPAQGATSAQSPQTLGVTAVSGTGSTEAPVVSPEPTPEVTPTPTPTNGGDWRNGWTSN